MFENCLTRPPNGFCFKISEQIQTIKGRLTRGMLQVGASTSEAARSFASPARSFKPTSSMSAGSHVAPKADPD
jgi:hypothetical protein